MKNIILIILALIIICVIIDYFWLKYPRSNIESFLNITSMTEEDSETISKDNTTCKITCVDSEDGVMNRDSKTSIKGSDIDHSKDLYMCKRIGFTDRGNIYNSENDIPWFEAEEKCKNDPKCISFTIEGQNSNQSNGNVKYFSTSLPLEIPPGLWKNMNYSNLYVKSNQPCIIQSESQQPNPLFNKPFVNQFVTGQQAFFDNFYTMRLTQDIEDPMGNNSMFNLNESSQSKFDDGKWHSFGGWMSQITTNPDIDLIYGVGNSFNVWSIAKDGGQWQEISRSCCVKNIVVKDNFFYGVGTDNNLYRRSINGTWERFEGTDQINGNLQILDERIYALGYGSPGSENSHLIYSVSTDAASNQNWIRISNPGSVMQFVIYKKMFYCVGTNGIVYKRTLTGNWQQISVSGYVTRIAVFEEFIYGVGTDHFVYRISVYGGNWTQLPNSCCVHYDLIADKGYLYCIGEGSRINNIDGGAVWIYKIPQTNNFGGLKTVPGRPMSKSMEEGLYYIITTETPKNKIPAGWKLSTWSMGDGARNQNSSWVYVHQSMDWAMKWRVVRGTKPNTWRILTTEQTTAKEPANRGLAAWHWTGQERDSVRNSVSDWVAVHDGSYWPMDWTIVPGHKPNTWRVITTAQNHSGDVQPAGWSLTTWNGYGAQRDKWSSRVAVHEGNIWPLDWEFQKIG